jgi:hypothetical protein
MIFGKKNRHFTPNIKIDGQSLDIVEETKFLGIILDDQLNWKKHIYYTSKKIAKAIGILSKTRQILNNSTLIQLYYSFVYPYLIYGNVIWGNAAASTLWPIFKLQKIAIRIITNTRRGDSTKQQSKKLNNLRLPELYTYNVAIFMFKFTHHMMSNSLENLFIKNNEIHHHNTRGAKNFRLPQNRTAMKQKFITTTGVKIWNELVPLLDPNQKLGAYKRSIITHLISNY